MNILYIPLDERPCNYRYPRFMAALADNINLISPPFEIMGKMKTPADAEKVWEWMFEAAPGCSHAILSVDMLVYGNIVNSRIHKRSMEQCEKYMENFAKLKKINVGMEIHAFNLVTRVADYNDSSEDPDYWKVCGRDICSYGRIEDKISRGVANEDERREFDILNERIPKAYLEDFLARREKNRFVNLKCVDLTNRGIIDFLVIPKDDCSEFGFAAMDQRTIMKEILAARIADRALVYPGADEVGTVLLGRIFNRINHFVPKIHIRYSSTAGPSVIPKYEDRPLNEGIKCQIVSLGGVIVDSEADSDFLFAVNSPGKRMLEASEQDSLDSGHYSNVNINEFLNYVDYYSSRYGKPYAIADVAFCNGSDRTLMAMAKQKGLFNKPCAYGGWNTAQNTVGVVLVQGLLLSYYRRFAGNDDKLLLSMKFLLRKIITDWFNQSEILPELYVLKRENPELDPDNVGDNTGLVVSFIEKRIGQMLDREFGGEFMGRKIRLYNLRLPWNRVFEIDFDIDLMDCPATNVDMR